MKKILSIICLMGISLPAFAGFKEHFELGQQYLSNFQYSGAITEFKSALRINYMDNSARIGLINSYLARGKYYADTEKNYDKASDDYRSALFYLIYYPNANQVKNSSQAIVSVTSNLNKCLNFANFDTSAQNRFNKAKQLRAEGNFSAAGYEFNQTLSDTSLIKESFKQIGDIMKLLGNDIKAVEYYKKAVSVAPDDTELRMAYAKMLDKLGQEDDAIKEYNYILGKTSDNKDMLYSLERIFKKKLEDSPNDASLTSNLGAIMQKEGNYDEALRYYSKAEYLDPSNINTRINVGTLYQQKGDYKTAITAYDSILILYPDNIEANIYKAQSLAKLGKKTESQEIFKKVLAKDPSNEFVQNEMISMIRESATPTEFVDYVKKNNPDNAGYLLYDYALDLHKKDKISDAISVYNEVIKLNPNNSEAYVNLAIAQSQDNDLTKALQTLESAKAKFPNNSQIADAMKSINSQMTDQKLNLASEYYNNKDYQKAIEEYLKITPTNSDIMLSVAGAYQNLGDIDKAIEYYKEALNLAPSNSDIAYYISALYADKEDLENAKLYAQKSLALNKSNKSAKDLLESINSSLSSQKLENAIALFDKEQYDESLALINEILSSNPKESYALYYRGMIYDTKQKYNDAINDYKKAISYNPDFPIINYLIGVDYDMLEKYKDAMSYYKAFTATYSEDDDYLKYANTRINELAPYVK